MDWENASERKQRGSRETSKVVGPWWCWTLRIEREVREVQGQGQVPAGSTVLRKILQGELVSQSLRDVLLSGTGWLSISCCAQSLVGSSLGSRASVRVWRCSSAYRSFRPSVSHALCIWRSGRFILKAPYSYGPRVSMCTVTMHIY